MNSQLCLSNKVMIYRGNRCWLIAGVMAWLIAGVCLLGCKPNSTTKAIEKSVDQRELTAEMADVPFEEQLAQVLAGTGHEIRLERSSVSAEQLPALAKATQLRALILDAGVMRDQDIQCLTSLSTLEHLRLRNSPLTDQALKDMANGQLDELRILNLPQAKLTADGLRELARLPRLRNLRIGGRSIDDAAIVALAKCPALSSLHLIQPGITDQSLETLAGMAELSSLYIDDCPLSDAAWEKLFAARPKMHVHIDQSHHDLDPHTDKH
ncbi:MAG: hypothetical protein IT423_11755 [Pirellulaceae bacterium]|nr:hypothetical protein [Pirellulaceae bacterium]